MNRLLVFLHFNPHGDLASHVLHTLKLMKPLYKHILVVSKSPLKLDDENNLRPFCHKIMERGDYTFDFWRFKEVLLEEGWHCLKTYDSLTLMNDNYFGPISDIEKMYQIMESPSSDYWGISNDQSNSEFPECNFLVFSSRVIHSPVFRDFWERVVKYKDNRRSIRLYRSKLNKILSHEGFQYQAYINNHIQNNKTSAEQDILIMQGNPFIKIKTFKDLPHPSYIKKMIEQASDYPVNLIDEYFTNTLHPNNSIKLCNKNFIISNQHKRVPSSHDCLLIALHFHVFYIDTFKKYIDHLKHANSCFHLYITTDTEEKREQVISILSDNSLDHSLKGIFVFDNRGRDVLAWLKISNILDHYDVVGHFHTKKTEIHIKWVGDSWQNEIIYNLIQPMDEIINLFNETPKLGILISDIPYYFKSLQPVDDGWGNNKTMVNDLWRKMNCRKELCINDINTPIMPYGTMFWYRPRALRPLFNLKLNDSDFPPEPLPNDGTIAHAIERLPVYLAWNEGYDFRVAISLEDYMNHYQIIERIIDVKKSYSYRIGDLILSLPKKIYRSFNN